MFWWFSFACPAQWVLRTFSICSYNMFTTQTQMDSNGCMCQGSKRWYSWTFIPTKNGPASIEQSQYRLKSLLGRVTCFWPYAGIWACQRICIIRRQNSWGFGSAATWAFWTTAPGGRTKSGVNTVPEKASSRNEKSVPGKEKKHEQPSNWS